MNKDLSNIVAKFLGRDYFVTNRPTDPMFSYINADILKQLFPEPGHYKSDYSIHYKPYFMSMLMSKKLYVLRYMNIIGELDLTRFSSGFSYEIMETVMKAGDEECISFMKSLNFPIYT